MDALVKHLLVTSTAMFDPRGTPEPATQYSYYIGPHGPFVDQFPRGTDTAEAVNAKIQDRINHLRAVGAIT